MCKISENIETVNIESVFLPLTLDLYLYKYTHKLLDSHSDFFLLLDCKDCKGCKLVLSHSFEISQVCKDCKDKKVLYISTSVWVLCTQNTGGKDHNGSPTHMGMCTILKKIIVSSKKTPYFKRSVTFKREELERSNYRFWNRLEKLSTRNPLNRIWERNKIYKNHKSNNLEILGHGSKREHIMEPLNHNFAYASAILEPYKSPKLGPFQTLYKIGQSQTVYEMDKNQDCEGHS